MDTTDWFTSWFNTPYYHILYKHRNDADAQFFMRNITAFLKLPKNSYIADLPCGKGRHSVYLNSLGYKVTGGDLTALEALTAVQNGEITLVDIRRPDEWHRTGIGQGAIAIDMRQQDFIDVLVEKNRGNMAAPVALICARGVRSRRMLKRLQDAGFTNILDVPEGMLGSGAGPGWLERGLPVVRP